MKERYGTLILVGTLLFLVLSRAEPLPEPPLALEWNREHIRLTGTVIRIVSDEMLAAAGSENIEEHLLNKAEQVFDDFAKESDFPGPDRITKPLARKLVHPVVKAVLRYIDKKGAELSQKQKEEQ